MKQYKENLLLKLDNTGLEGPLKDGQYYKLIADIMGEIHSAIPKEEYDVSKVPVSTNIREEIFQGVNYQRAVLYLLSNGCEWALKNANGCTMCGHIAKQTRRDSISAVDYLRQFTTEFAQVDFARSPLLSVFNNGSFLNDREIPAEARREILKHIAGNPDIKMVVFESRPEFVTEEKIREVKELIPDKHVEVAMGLEMKDNLWRTICINKGFSLQQYDAAAQIITKHLKLRTYVLLKPPFLTEREGVEEAVRTINHAFKLGSSTVSLEACTIQDFTLVKYLHERDMYLSPWLWSIVEVVKQTYQQGKLIVGLFQFYPSPEKVPYNCPTCSDKVLAAIKEYNRTLNGQIFTTLACECKKDWEKALAGEVIPFHERLEILTRGSK